MATPKTKTELLKSHANELVKQYIEFDGQGRSSKVYTAYTDAVHGAPCEVTEYIYNSPTSTVVKARKEGYAAWDSAWDADFTVSAN
jgi:hypothetical protein